MNGAACAARRASGGPGRAWAQLPIQIDERAVVNFGKIYNDPNVNFYGSQPGLRQRARVHRRATRSPATTRTRSSTPTTSSCSWRATRASLAPAGHATRAARSPSSGTQIKVTDPLDPGAEGYVYLFKQGGGQRRSQQGARRQVREVDVPAPRGRVQDARTSASRTAPNPENSLVTGATYRHHFSDRWASDRIEVTAPGATRRRHPRPAQGALLARRSAVAARTRSTRRSRGSVEGAFVTIKAGPVRAIRSYLGANSGPNTQRTHFFYDRREDIVTNLRVHSIPSIMDFFDYSAGRDRHDVPQQRQPDRRHDRRQPRHAHRRRADVGAGHRARRARSTRSAPLQTTGFTPTVDELLPRRHARRRSRSAPATRSPTASSGLVRHEQHPEHRPGDRRHRVAHRDPGHVLREPGRHRRRRRPAERPGGSRRSPRR